MNISWALRLCMLVRGSSVTGVNSTILIVSPPDEAPSAGSRASGRKTAIAPTTAADSTLSARTTCARRSRFGRWRDLLVATARLAKQSRAGSDLFLCLFLIVVRSAFLTGVVVNCTTGPETCGISPMPQPIASPRIALKRYRRSSSRCCPKVIVLLSKRSSLARDRGMEEWGVGSGWWGLVRVDFRLRVNFL